MTAIVEGDSRFHLIKNYEERLHLISTRGSDKFNYANLMTSGIEIQENYKPRPICFLELWETFGWRLKVYGIAYRRSVPRPELIAAAKVVAHQRLLESANDQKNYGVGFLGIHDGRTANFVFVDWWAEENELHHHVYVSHTDKPEMLEYVTPTGLVACVWDLRVLSFERQAWVDTILKKPNNPDLEAYVQSRLEELV